MWPVLSGLLLAAIYPVIYLMTLGVCIKEPCRGEKDREKEECID